MYRTKQSKQFSRRYLMKDNAVSKIIIILLVALYLFSPIDLLPGPIDDLIVAIAAIRSLLE